MDAQLSAFDAWMMPTTAIVAPTIAEMQDTHTFNTKNMLLLRNTLTWNFFDNCAISIPIPGSGLPVGLMLVGAQRARPPPVRDRGRDRAAVCRVSARCRQECYKA